MSPGRGDDTVHVVAGLDPEDRMYLLDVWRRQSASNEWIEAFCGLVLAWKPIGWAEESGQIASGIGPFLEKRMRERRAHVYRQPFAARLDKAVRAQSIRGRMALDGLYVQHAESLAAMLLAGWVSRDDVCGERLISSEQIRDVLISVDDDFRSQTIWYLNRWSHKQESSWYTQTPTFITEVWSRQNAAKSSQASARFVELAFSQKDRFPEYARAILPLLVRIDRDHLFLGGDRREPNEIVQKHPSETLALLSAVLPEDAQRWPYGIIEVIALIGKAEPNLMTDPRLVELNRIAGRQ